MKEEEAMEVRMAEHLGMCFGVRDAITLARDLAREGPLTIFGDLVHNPNVVAELEAVGAARAKDPADLRTQRVLLTAHGTANRVKLQLERDGFKIHDAVCPLVSRVHSALLRLVEEDRHPVIIGQPGHVEVRGLIGDLDRWTVIHNECDIDELAGLPRLGVVAQTTQPIAKVLDLVEAIRKRFPLADVRFIDTVCQPTKDRQIALEQLAAEAEAIVVVGGPDSNNSRKLTELAHKLGRAAYQVANESELRPEWFTGMRVVGLTAGTSTPDPVIAAVRTRLEAL
jgi:4-hydroxy-3-methylbut-2-enyl diphosphate reductase